MQNTFIAQVCHEANRALCETQGDPSQPSWNKAPDWMRDSAIAGVNAVLENPAITPEELHERWCQHKLNDGWRYGPEKDAEAKTHPCLVGYDSLPPEQRIKDSLFHAVVRALS